MPSCKQTFYPLIRITSHHCRLTYRYFTINMQKCKLVFWITRCLYYSCGGWKFWGLNSRMVVFGVMTWWDPWHMLMKGYEVWGSCTLLGNWCLTISFAWTHQFLQHSLKWEVIRDWMKNLAFQVETLMNSASVRVLSSNCGVILILICSLMIFN
jgi:hypothetical protein